MNGCCADKPYGKGCNERTCMTLPAGETCSTCVHAYRCTTMFGAKPADTNCGFFPRRFQKGVAASAVAQGIAV